MTDDSGNERGPERREKPAKAREHEEDIQRPGIEELRRIRSDFYANSAGFSNTDTKASKIPSTSVSRASLSSTKPGSRCKHKSRSKHSSVADESQRRQKNRLKDAREKISTETYVYEVNGERVTETTTTYLEKGKGSEDAAAGGKGTMADIQEEYPPDLVKKVRVIYVTREKPRSSRHGSTRHEGRDRSSSDSPHRNSSSKIVVNPPPADIKRSSSPDVHSTDVGKPRRSQSHAPNLRPRSYPQSDVNIPARRSSVLAGFFGPQTSHAPVKLTECTVCLADDIPSTKCAKLKCGHRMCDSCLKRIFKLSVTDPEHMPPRCCTRDHIPLHHVDNLFDIPFKKRWNRKFQEYTTKNRIYCPSRRCGEFIKPEKIHKDKDGKKYGVCGSCKTKVCCVCNGKWHGSEACPKDGETARLLETAKQAGWKRCYNCRTMVELKEGCNHMTCRCRAEFCMVCGLKWKTCDCPWFNYETLENDRLLHMRIPGDPFLAPSTHVRNLHHSTYDDEGSARRRQERADERLARRLHDLTDPDFGTRDDDYNGGIGDIKRIGNGARHFMNESFRRPSGMAHMMRDLGPPASMRYAPPPRLTSLPPRIKARDMIERYPPPDSPPPARREVIEEIIDLIPIPKRAPASIRNKGRASKSRSSDSPSHPARSEVIEEIIELISTPKRVPASIGDKGRDSKTLDYPTPKTPERYRGLATKRRTLTDDSLGSSELAGLNTGGSGGGSGRVKAWRSHVRPGVEPEEGMFNMV